jgi:hypothetical protein
LYKRPSMRKNMYLSNILPFLANGVKSNLI